MKKRILIIIMVMALILSACGKKPAKEVDNTGDKVISDVTDNNNTENEEQDDEEGENEPVEEAEPLTLDEYLALRTALRNGEEAVLPQKLDLRDYGMVTPARDQGQYETCWTFGSMGAIESNAIVSGFGEYNFSEYELGYTTLNILEDQDESIAGEGVKCDCKWFDYPAEPRYVYGPFMRGYIPVTENDQPYRNIIKKLPHEALTSTVFNSHSCYTIPANDIELIKKMVIMNGSLTIGINALPWLEAYGTYDRYAFYDNETTIDHYVTIVGWDDTYSIQNAPDTGAWFLKNSWGPSWGIKGHCYVSYYDGALNATNKLTSFVLTSKDAYDYQYQYDGAFGVGQLKSVTDVAIEFTVKEDQTITGVKIYPQLEFDGTLPASNVTIKVFKGITSVEETENAAPIYTQVTPITLGGYQMLEFDEGVNINKGDNILVTVTFDAPVKYAMDCPSKCKVVDQFNEVRWCTVTTYANPNETFYKVTDDNNWKDAAVETENANMCIKVTVRNGHNKEVIHRMSIIR